MNKKLTLFVTSFLTLSELTAHDLRNLGDLRGLMNGSDSYAKSVTFKKRQLFNKVTLKVSLMLFSLLSMTLTRLSALNPELSVSQPKKVIESVLISPSVDLSNSPVFLE